MVSTCEFDEDAILLRPAETSRLLQDDGGLKLASKGFYLFFPGFLKALRGMEKMLRPLPLGGQYFVVASKS